MLDSSSKTPSAFIDGTVTSLGDYDQCLSITKGPLSPVDGKYCLVDVFPLDYTNASRKDGQLKDKKRVSLNKMRYFRDSAYYFAICLPSECSEEDTRSLFKSALKDLPLAVEGFISCDTAESTSWSTRLSELRPISIAGIIYLSLVLALVAYGTVCHFFQSEPSELVKGVSAIENLHKLFWVRSSNRSELILPYFKCFIVVSGLAAHVMSCLESAIGFMMLSHQRVLEDILTNPALVSLFGEAGIVCATSVAGYSLFMLGYPMVVKEKMSIIMFTLNKVLRFLPSVLAIMSLDVLWFLPLTGPFVTRVGQMIVDKCTETWWKSALFVNNLWGGTLQICSGHTYSLSVDVQLTIVGLFAVILLARKPILGFIYCMIFVVGGTCWLFYSASKNQVPANLMVAHSPSLEEIEAFLTYVHMATSNYVPSYFMGILTGYIVYQGWTKKIASNHLLMFSVIGILAMAVQHSTILTNTLQIITPDLVPYYIVICRIIVAVECSFTLIWISHFDGDGRPPAEEKSPSENAKVQASKQVNEEDGYYSYVKGILRSTFAIYMVNYTYIRTDFFISRNVFYTSIYVLVSIT